MNNLIGIREASRLIGLKPTTIYKLVRNREIPFIKPLKSKVLFDPKRLKDWLQKKSVEPGEV
jgi:excisionase family DNA binding protein